MASPNTIGVGAGLLSTMLAIAGNVRRGDRHLVSAAPDLLTLIAIGAVVWLAVRWTVAQPYATGRRSARRTTVVASAVFAIGMGTFTLWYLPSHAPVLAAFGAGSGFLLAYLAGFVASRTTQERASVFRRVNPAG